MTTDVKRGQSVLMIDPQKIHSNPNQPRKAFDVDELLSLAKSICSNGLLQPVTVRRRRDGDYELVAGERRLRASILAGLELIPCLEIAVDQPYSAILALLENIQRQDLTFFEEAEGMATLISVWGVTQEEAAARLGKAQSTVANKLRLLKITKPQRDRITSGGLTERHARALLRIEDDAERENAIETVISRHLNVAQTEELVEGVLTPKIRHAQRHTPMVRDVRLFNNTINKALQTMKLSGLQATSVRSETDEFIEYTIRIAKTAQLKSA